MLLPESAGGFRAETGNADEFQHGNRGFLFPLKLFAADSIADDLLHVLRNELADHGNLGEAMLDVEIHDWLRHFLNRPGDLGVARGMAFLVAGDDEEIPQVAEAVRHFQIGHVFNMGEIGGFVPKVIRVWRLL